MLFGMMIDVLVPWEKSSHFVRKNETPVLGAE